MVAPPPEGDPSNDIIVTVSDRGLENRMKGPFNAFANAKIHSNGIWTCLRTTRSQPGLDANAAHNLRVNGFTCGQRLETQAMRPSGGCSPWPELRTDPGDSRSTLAFSPTQLEAEGPP